FRDLGIRKERAGASDFPARVAFFRDEFFGGLAFLDPADDGLVKSGGRGAGAAEAVIDAGREEQARELRGLLLPTHLSLHSLVIIDAARGGNEFVRQSVVNDDLAAVVAEACQVRVVGADDRAVLF